MSIKKYRFYLLMVTLIVIIAGALSYLYFSEQEKTYHNATLVHNSYTMEEIFL